MDTFTAFASFALVITISVAIAAVIRRVGGIDAPTNTDGLFAALFVSPLQPGIEIRTPVVREGEAVPWRFQATGQASAA